MTRELVHSGGVLNARVYRVRDDDGKTWIEKDFSASPRLVRNTIGRFLVLRECWVLGKLESETDIVPGGVRRVSPFCLREDFVEGPNMRERSDAERAKGVVPGSGRIFPREFFDRLDSGIRAAHAAGFVHLDLHNARNVMVCPGWRPVLVDWQSAMPTHFLPRPIRHALERIDLAGEYKFREKFRPGELRDDERQFLRRSMFLRHHFWMPRVHRKR